MTANDVRKPRKTDLMTLADALAPLPFFSPQNDSSVLFQAWLRRLENDEGLLAVYDNDRPRGLCRLLTSGTFGNGAYLRLIVVVPSDQGRGLGACLLAAFEDACQSATGGCFVLTQGDNQAARQFYARNGYETVGQLPGFAGPGRTDRRLWKVSGPASICIA